MPKILLDCSIRHSGAGQNLLRVDFYFEKNWNPTRNSKQLLEDPPIAVAFIPE